MTRAVIEAAAHQLGTDRRGRWLACGTHGWRAFPRTSDTDEHFCENCATLFSREGAVLNIPQRPHEF